MKAVSLYTPYPNVPENLKSKYSIENISVRGFGLCVQDLDVNLDQVMSPSIVTNILQCCLISNDGTPLDESFFWDMTIGKRIECLLTIMTLSDVHELFFEIDCGNPICQKPIQIELSIIDLIKHQHIADKVDKISIPVDSELILLRKPTGFDQIKMIQMANKEDENILLRKIIQLLVIDRNEDSLNKIALLPNIMVKNIENALSDADPLINFSLEIQCPYCEGDGIYQIKLEEFVHQKLYQVQTNLIKSIHKIARNYHWSEDHIVSLPSWRRTKYLSFIDKEWDKI